MSERKFPETLGPMTRDVAAEALAIREEEATTKLSFALSSEAPIERWFGTEVLSHAEGAIRLERIRSGAMPLLFNHDWDDPIGMIDDARIEGGRLVVDAHLFATPRAQEVATMLAGGLRNVSVGYRMHVVEEDRDTETYTARDWEPFEGSIVTVPADPSVGIGRSGDQLVVRMLNNSPTVSPTVSADPAIRSMEMSEQKPEVKITAEGAEKERKEAIVALARSFKIDSRVEAGWIEDGLTLAEVSRQIEKTIEERGKARPATAAEIGLSRKEAENFSIFRAVRALKFGAQHSRFMEEAAYEIDCSRAVAKKLGREMTTSFLIPAEVLTRPMGPEAMARAMATTPGNKGGYMVNVQNMGFIDILRNRSVAMSMGARELAGLEGNVVFPRQTGKATVTWQGGEHTSVTATDQALGQLSMTPKTAIVITDVSEQLLRQSSPSAEQFVMADLAADIAIDGVDASVINGTGGAQPLGIKNTTGVTTGQDAGTATYAKILAFPVAAGAANAIRGNPGWVTNITGASVLMQRYRVANTDTPLWEGNLMDGQLVGFRAMSSEQIASGNLIFGSWDEVVVGSWGVLELAMDSGGTRFNAATVGIRAMWMVDVMLRYPQSFVVSTSLS